MLNHSYKTKKVNIVIKQEGIILDVANNNIFTFENVRDIVLRDINLENEKIFMFRWNEQTKDIETQYMNRTVQPTIDTKINVLSNYTTTPFGYIPA